jgi:ankyrin repeat protein
MEKSNDTLSKLGYTFIDQWYGIHFAAQYGLEGALRHLIASGFSADLKDDNGRTPLSRATENGHDVVVQLLLQQSDVDLNSKSTSFGQMLLSWATEK